ncbi:MAG: hypothetical protein EB051_04390, partial [Chlamydiia bacterium]|nr:hypothetical protein [Chlamydiia bacterium]
RSDWQIASGILFQRRQLILKHRPGFLEEGGIRQSVGKIGDILLLRALDAQRNPTASIKQEIETPFVSTPTRSYTRHQSSSLSRPSSPHSRPSFSPSIGDGGLTTEENLIEAIVTNCPKFNSYRIGSQDSQISLSALSIRPSNLLFEALGAETTMPGSGQLFAFLDPAAVKTSIEQASPDTVVEVSALGKTYTLNGRQTKNSLDSLLGQNTYRISYGELQDTLKSQKIYLTTDLSKEIYQGLKQALIKDGIVTLPVNDHTPWKVRDLLTDQTPACKAFLSSPQADGINESGWDLTLYQLGSMVVKTENYYLMADVDGKLLPRQVGDRDEIRLINACGIRGIRQEDLEINKGIMQATFKAALQGAESGFLVFPAVGMGVWRGGPEVYWPAFLEAVESSKADNLDWIFINPRHQPTANGPYKDSDGSELPWFVHERLTALYELIEKTEDVNKQIEYRRCLDNLGKICNLYDNQTDLLQLAYRLKKGFPDKTVSIFNASDPDVTLGNHVTEYMNNCPHPAPTTEEHYSMLGTNGLCFESITGVHDNPEERIIQVV